MTIDFPVASVDGFGDRDDIALARDRQNGQIYENKQEFDLKLQEALDRSRAWGMGSTAKPISRIVKEMIESECYARLIYKSDMIWDVESIGEALDEALVVLGLGSEEFAASYQDKGHEIDLRLF